MSPNKEIINIILVTFYKSTTIIANGLALTLITHCFMQIVFSDVDECVLGSYNCAAHALCSNIPGSYTCQCDYANGYYSNGTECCSPYVQFVTIIILFNFVT